MFFHLFFGQQYLIIYYIKHTVFKPFFCHNVNGDLSAERKEDQQSRSLCPPIFSSIIEATAV